MRKLVIAVDCDDVLTQTLPKVVKDYNQLYGARVELRQMYDESEATLVALGVSTIQEALERFHAMYKQKDYYLHLPLVPGAQSAIAALASVHELHVVTGRQAFLEEVTKQTIARDFPNMFHSVEVTNYYKDHNENAQAHRSKAEVCKNIGADVLIDDHVVHGEDVLAAGVERVILFGAYPWNERDELIDGMTRCPGWDAAVREVERIVNE